MHDSVSSATPKKGKLIVSAREQGPAENKRDLGAERSLTLFLLIPSIYKVQPNHFKSISTQWRRRLTKIHRQRP